MITINYYSKHILKICFFSLLFSVFSLSHAEETLPNFTKIVEKNLIKDNGIVDIMIAASDWRARND